MTKDKFELFIDKLSNENFAVDFFTRHHSKQADFGRNITGIFCGLRISFDDCMVDIYLGSDSYLEKRFPYQTPKIKPYIGINTFGKKTIDIFSIKNEEYNQCLYLIENKTEMSISDMSMGKMDFKEAPKNAFNIDYLHSPILHSPIDDMYMFRQPVIIDYLDHLSTSTSPISDKIFMLSTPSHDSNEDYFLKCIKNRNLNICNDAENTFPMLTKFCDLS